MVLDDGSAAISDPTLYEVAFHEESGSFDRRRRDRYTTTEIHHLFPSGMFSPGKRDVVTKALGKSVEGILEVTAEHRCEGDVIVYYS